MVVFEHSPRQMTENTVPMAEAGTISILRVLLIVTCAPNSYIVVATQSSVPWS